MLNSGFMPFNLCIELCINRYHHSPFLIALTQETRFRGMGIGGTAFADSKDEDLHETAQFLATFLSMTSNPP